jgi:hypothetical protein
VVHTEEIMLTVPADQIKVCTSTGFSDFFLLLPLEIHVFFAIINSAFPRLCAILCLMPFYASAILHVLFFNLAQEKGQTDSAVLRIRIRSIESNKINRKGKFNKVCLLVGTCWIY